MPKPLPAVTGAPQSTNITYVTTIDYDAGKLAEGFGLDAGEVEDYCTDGRRISFANERRLVAFLPDATIAPSENDGYDLEIGAGKPKGKWEVRSIPVSGSVNFRPSNQTGKGRKYEEAGFLEKLTNLKGFILVDLSAFPRCPAWMITSKLIRRWHESGHLTEDAAKGRTIILATLEAAAPVV